MAAGGALGSLFKRTVEECSQAEDRCDVKVMTWKPHVTGIFSLHNSTVCSFLFAE